MFLKQGKPLQAGDVNFQRIPPWDCPYHVLNFFAKSQAHVFIKLFL